MENDPQNPERRSEWETLVDVLAGFRPEQVEPLAAARDLEMVYPLLHALTRGGLGEFFVRVAALEAFIADGRSPLKPQEAVQVLYWLKEPESILKILRESGWMEHEPGGGYRITDAGRFVATVLSFLRHQVKDQALLPTLEGVDYMLRCGVDPVRQLMSRELFRWVMDARGSQDVLERYSSARHRYQDSLQEVHNQRMQSLRQNADLVRVEREVRRLDEYESHVKRVSDAESLSIGAQFQAKISEVRELERKLPDLRTKVTSLINTVGRLDSETEDLRLALEKVQQTL